MPRFPARSPLVAAPPSHGSASAHDGADALREEARFLHWFGQETIAFNRGYVEITGNVVSALWLSYVLERMPQDVRSGRGQLADERYRFSMTAADCEAATGITRAQQTGCRSQLEDLGLVRVDGVRGKVASYTIDLRRLREIMTEQSRPLLAALQEARMHECAVRNGFTA
jgi:hypothetical protein